MQALRDDAELRRKQEIHEAEESKNAHIQDLMKKHEKVRFSLLPYNFCVRYACMRRCGSILYSKFRARLRSMLTPWNLKYQLELLMLNVNSKYRLSFWIFQDVIREHEKLCSCLLHCVVCVNWTCALRLKKCTRDTPRPQEAA